jgi:hypothetical protein
MRARSSGVAGKGRVLARLALASALLALPAASQAGKTHLLQSPESLVVLTSISASGVDQCSSNWTNRVLARVQPDGSAGSEEFVVPAGFTLIVTDIDWTTMESPNNFSQGMVQYFSISLGGGTNPVVFRAPTIIDADIAAAGITAGSVSLTTGFRVPPGVPICPTAGSHTSSLGATNTVTSLTLRGYLMKSK